MALKFLLALASAAVVQLVLAENAAFSGMLLHKTLFGPCAYLGAPCAPKNTVCTVFPAAQLSDGSVTPRFLHSQVNRRTKRQIGGNGFGGFGGGLGGGQGGGGFGGLGGGLGGGGFGNGNFGGNRGQNFFGGGGNNFGPGGGGGGGFQGGFPGGQGGVVPNGGGGGGGISNGGNAVYGQQQPSQPPPTTTTIEIQQQAPPPQIIEQPPAPSSSYGAAPPPPPPPCTNSYGCGGSTETTQVDTNVVVQAIGGYGETTDQPIVINEETVVLPGTEEEQPAEYKYYDTRADTNANKELQSQKEIHSYTVQKHRINKKIYNVHRTHQHEHINTNHVLNVYRHNHPHTQTEYVTYIHNQYVPKKYVHYSRTDQVQEKGVEEHPTQDVVQKTVQAAPEYAPVEVVQTGYDGNALPASAPAAAAPSGYASSSSSSLAGNSGYSDAAAAQSASTQIARHKRAIDDDGMSLQAICMCAETFVPAANGCDCPRGKSVQSDTGRCA